MIVYFKILFYTLIFLIIYIIFGYQLILRLKIFYNKKIINKFNREKPSVTLLISVYNEEKVIDKKIKNSLALDYKNMNIIVSSDGSTDKTNEISKKYLSENLHVFAYKNNRGKNSAINDSISKITSDIVVLSDANVLYKKDCICRLVERFSDRVGCVVGELKLQNESMSSIGEGEVKYWAYESNIKELESELGSVLVSNGSVCAIRRKLFTQLNFDGIADDFQIPMDIAYNGYYVVYEKKALGFEKTTTDLKEELNRKIRIINQGLLGFQLLRNRIKGFRLFQFISHKFLRWFIGIWAILVFISNFVLVDFVDLFNIYNVLFFGQNIFYILASVGYILKNIKKLHLIFYGPMYICMICIAGIIALIKYFKGYRFEKWEKAESSR